MALWWWCWWPLGEFVNVQKDQVDIRNVLCNARGQHVTCVSNVRDKLIRSKRTIENFFIAKWILLVVYNLIDLQIFWIFEFSFNSILINIDSESSSVSAKFFNYLQFEDKATLWQNYIKVRISLFRSQSKPDIRRGYSQISYIKIYNYVLPISNSWLVYLSQQQVCKPITQ